MRKSRNINLYLLLSSAFFVLAFLFGCGEVGQKETTQVSISFKIPPANQKVLQAAVPSGITSITLEVTATDMQEIIKEVAVTKGETVTIDLEVPSGPLREFKARAFDNNNTLIFQGKTTSDLVAGVAITIKIDMEAATHTIQATAGANGAITPSGAVTVNHGSSQTFTITPNAGFHMQDIIADGTSAGAAAIASGSYTFVNVTSDHTISASFTIDTFTLNVTKSGTGSGTVTSSPAGINCGASCTAIFAPNTIVTLTATPTTGSIFAGWSGDGCTGTGPCTVIMNAATSVTATFNLPTLTVTKSGTGSGTVTSSPAGINCGASCTAIFAPNTIVTLTATPTTGSIFAGWSGDPDCTDGTVTMGVSKTCTATFTLVQINNLALFKTVTLNGGLASSGVGLRGIGSGTINLTGIPAGSTVQQAIIYWGTIGSSSAFTSITFNNTPVNGFLIGSSGDTCWGALNNFSYRADVTSLVSGNGSYSIAGLPSSGPTINDSQGASLVVIFTNPTFPSRTIVINDGAVSLTPSSLPTFTTTLSGFTAPNLVVSTQLTFIVGDGQTFGDSASFNGTVLSPIQPGNFFPGLDGNFWDTITQDVTAHVTPGSTSATATIDTNSDCLVWIAAAFQIDL